MYVYNSQLSYKSPMPTQTLKMADKMAAIFKLPPFKTRNYSLRPKTVLIDQFELYCVKMYVYELNCKNHTIYTYFAGILSLLIVLVLNVGRKRLLYVTN